MNDFWFTTDTYEIHIQNYLIQWWKVGEYVEYDPISGKTFNSFTELFEILYDIFQDYSDVDDVVFSIKETLEEELDVRKIKLANLEDEWERWEK